MKTLYYGGSIVTMESIGDMKEAVLVEDGVITKVGSLETLELEIGSDVVKVDLQGKRLMPSFIDGHGHIAMNGFMTSFADLSGCRNFDDIVDTLKQYIVKNKISSGMCQ